MSQVLNCIWVLLSVWAFLHWLGLPSRQSSAARAQLFGLLCVLALLFPVISDNDDLVQQQLLSSPASPVLKSLIKAIAVCDDATALWSSVKSGLFRNLPAQSLTGSEPVLLVAASFAVASGDRSPPPRS